jgi:hypothetical protein
MSKRHARARVGGGRSDDVDTLRAQVADDIGDVTTDKTATQAAATRQQVPQRQLNSKSKARAAAPHQQSAEPASEAPDVDVEGALATIAAAMTKDPRLAARMRHILPAVAVDAAVAEADAQTAAQPERRSGSVLAQSPARLRGATAPPPAAQDDEVPRRTRSASATKTRTGATTFPQIDPHDPAGDPSETTARAQVLINEQHGLAAKTTAEQQRAVSTWVYTKATGVVNAELAHCAGYLRHATNQASIAAVGRWIGNTHCGEMAVTKHREFIEELEDSAQRELEDFLLQLSSGHYNDQAVLYPPQDQDNAFLQEYVVDVLAWAAIVRGMLARGTRRRVAEVRLSGIFQFAHGALAVLRTELGLAEWNEAHLAISARNQGTAREIEQYRQLVAGGNRVRAREDSAHAAGPATPASPAAAQSNKDAPRKRNRPRHRGGKGKKTNGGGGGGSGGGAKGGAPKSAKPDAAKP